MTNLRKLVSELNTLCDRLDEDYNINFGGCCYVAYILMKNFESIGIHPTLVIESDCDEIDGGEFLDCVKDSVDFDLFCTYCQWQEHKH